MFEMILASLLFHAAAGTALMLLAAGVAVAEMRRRRATGTVVVQSHDLGTVLDLPSAPRAQKRVVRSDVEEQSEAA